MNACLCVFAGVGVVLVCVHIVYIVSGVASVYNTRTTRTTQQGNVNQQHKNEKRGVQFDRFYERVFCCVK